MYIPLYATFVGQPLEMSQLSKRRTWETWAASCADRVLSLIPLRFFIHPPRSPRSPRSAPPPSSPIPLTPPYHCPPSPSPVRDRSASPARSRSGSPSPHDTLTLRALVSTKEAGIIIGKGGKNVADLREQTGVKAGVSKVIQGVHERVLTVTGPVEGVSKAYTLIISQLVTSTPSSPVTLTSPSSSHTSIRLLISHNLMGTIIGRNGLKIKAIQDGSGARMVASKDMLPQSTERIVEVQGSPDAIGRAIEEIGKCLLEDWERGLGTVLFHPGTGEDRGGSGGRRGGANGYSGGYGGGRRANGDARGRASSPPPSPPADGSSTSPAQPTNLRTQNISIPSDMVGCIIGRSGTKITEIRRLSGSKISIAKAPHDETGERMFTIIGTPEANEKALFLLYNQLESEKERRVGRDQQPEAQE